MKDSVWLWTPPLNTFIEVEKFQTGGGNFFSQMFMKTSWKKFLAGAGGIHHKFPHYRDGLTWFLSSAQQSQGADRA